MVAPFYFAWADQGETTFGPQHQIYDEHVLDFNIEHSEGDFSTLTIDIRNPRIGLLALGRKVWAWFSWLDPSTNTAIPLFFGRLVGIPTNVLAEVVTVQFVARPFYYISNRQTVAETLKVRPFWDPVFIDPLKRDDPDTILEGYSAHWHIDRVTHAVTISDILVGEDGTETFLETDSFYDSVNVHLNQQPLSAIEVNATVTWNQKSRGTVDIGNRIFQSYSGDGLRADWPQPGAELQAGWSVQYANSVDVKHIEHALTATWSFTYNNTQKTHIDGDVMSVSISQSVPQIVDFKESNITVVVHPGFIDAFALDGWGFPAPINNPASVDITKLYVPLWQVNTALVLRYDSDRPRTENLSFMLKSDLQPILTLPTVQQDSELIKMAGADVGVPIIKLLDWTSVRNSAVAFGQVIFPDNPLLPGQQVAQICIVAGTAGDIEPEFGVFAGETTVDNTVTWSSLGDTAEPGTAADWTFQTLVPLGEIILPRVPFWTTWASLEQAGLAEAPPAGVSTQLYQIVQASNGSYQICTLAGLTGISEPSFSTTWGTVTADGTAEWTSLGTALPTGKTYFVCTQSGETGGFLPAFNNTDGATTSDGTVVWTCIGTADVPIGGWPGNITRRSYFPTDRGLWSLEYLISVARAHLLYRARAVQISFDCQFERAINLSCRKNALLYDRRLPGGQALGKIISYSIRGNGDSGQIIGKATIGCAVGLGSVATQSPGTATYVEIDYVDYYQVYSGTFSVLPAGDVSYTVPVDAVNDDGLVFPLTKSQVVVNEEVHGSIYEQVSAIQIAFDAARFAANFQYILGYTFPFLSAAEANLLIQQVQIAESAFDVAHELKYHPIWYDLQLKPVSNGPFQSEYAIEVSNLGVPKMIDLEAPSSS